MAFPGGAGYGDPSKRPMDKVNRDLAQGCFASGAAAKDHGLTGEDIAAVETATRKEETV